jgi:hypothetical protein
MKHDLLVLAIAALIPLIVGSAWYSPLLFAKAWMGAVGLAPEDAKKSNMALNMLLLYVFSFFIAFALVPIVIHQFGFMSMLMDQSGKDALENAAKGQTSPLYSLIVSIYSTHGHSFRTYKHGALHGTIAAITLVLPLVASCAVFERRGFKYVMITWGFWLINFILMGAVICHWFWVPLDNLH